MEIDHQGVLAKIGVTATLATSGFARMDGVLSDDERNKDPDPPGTSKEPAVSEIDK